MKLTSVCILVATQASYGQTPGSFGVVNIVPTELSGSANDYFAEPSICVGTGPDAGKIVVHTFANGSPSQFFASQNSGIQWKVSGSLGDSDATVDWSPGGSAYVAYLDPSYTSLLVRPSVDPTTVPFDPPYTLVNVSDPNLGPDQPHVQAVHVNGMDHIYIGYNDFRQPPSTASVLFSLNSGQTWNNTLVEQVPPVKQDDPTVRVAVSSDGNTVYAAFIRWVLPLGPPVFPGLDGWSADVVVVRDDNSGLDGFADLPLDSFNAHETIVTHDIAVPDKSYLGVEAIGGCSLAINPSHPNQVYVAVTSLCSISCVPCTATPCVHLYASSDSGQTFQEVLQFPGVFEVFEPAGLPELAVATDGTVGMLWLGMTSDGSTYGIQLFKSYNGISTGRVLASFPVNIPPRCCGDPYLGDYFGLKAVGTTFYGVFSASGDPQASHFPPGTYYQRYVSYKNADGGVTLRHNFPLETDGGVLDDGNKNPVPFGIDPFFFYDATPPPALLTIAPPIAPSGGLTGQAVVLTWAALPANYPQFKLESSPTLGSGAIWSPVPLVIQTNGAFHAAVVPNQARQFFRLKQDLTGSQFNIFTADDGNGTLAPGGIVAVAGGQNQTFTATPGSNYAVGLWYLDGVPLQRGAPTLTLTNVSQDHTLLATFTASNDLAVTLTSLPRDPTLPVLTNELDYTVRIVNTGLNPLTGITLTNLFDPTVIFLSSTSSQGSFSYSAGTLTGILGALGTGAVATVTMAVVPTVPSTVTDILSAACDQFEPNLANNSATDMLNVLMPLAITSQPQSQSVPLDGTAVFTVGVSGTPPFGYQWYFDGSFLAGQTNATLTLNNVTNGIAGSYSVSVVQLAARPESRSALASDPATLTVQ